MMIKTDIRPLTQEPDVLLGEGGPSEAGWHTIEDFLRCPKEYQYRHVRGIHRPATSNPDYFSVGSIVHAMRARWFALKFATDAKAWSKLMDAAQIEAEKQRLPVTLRAEQYARSYFEQYVEFWQARPRPKPIAAEYLLGPAPLQKDDPFFFYRTARLDDVSYYPEAGDALCIGECKTDSVSVKNSIDTYTLHGQPLLQMILWNQAKQGRAKHGPAAGLMLDVIVKGYGGKRCTFARQFIPITDRALTWFTANMRNYVRAASHVDWNAEAPRNPTACTRLIGRARVPCEFRDLCNHGRSATVSYVLKDGSSLLTWKKDAEKETAPWD